MGAPRRALPYIDPRDEAVLGAWNVCAVHLDERQAAAGTDLRLAALRGECPAPTPLGRRLAAAAGELGDAIRRRNLAEADGAASRLLGLGTGLTPAGDDFLCGLVAACRCVEPPGGPDRRFTAAWGQALSTRLEATTAISATFLECAINGCFAGAVTTLIEAMADGSATAAREALDHLCARGHSSGMDTATGLLFGLWLRTDGETRRHAP